ncbi:LysM peptidoglycan-binding domain-containing protein [Streptomyces durbertensis]|uniref:LysM peptidoglycan-binding domain-containing protein n=1 Tax=Streptomyces durbertensis TaxID=2448886 RepID=A0ABR6ELP3_9ACTN|nr:LysM peptidoglycan-binding domain-containing protein [Streptomyces durbertensis]
MGRHVDRVRRAATNQTGYRVAEGDTLSTIADRHAVEGGWSALYEHNEETVGTNPDRILPGQLLDLAGLTTATDKR